MKAVDVNVLLNAVNSRAVDHLVSRDWLGRSLNGEASVGFAWLVLIGFVRLSTRRGILTTPLTTDQAITVVRGWLERPTVYVLHPTERHFDVLADLLGQAGVAGNLTNDAHLAALAIEHRAQVVTFDADFDRFPGVRWTRPS